MRLSLLDRFRLWKVRHMIGAWHYTVYKLNTKHGYEWAVNQWLPKTAPAGGDAWAADPDDD